MARDCIGCPARRHAADGGIRRMQRDHTDPPPQSSSASVRTADELIGALNSAASGDVVTLGADITVNPATFGTFAVNKEVTIDCNGHKLSADNAGGAPLFTVSKGGTLTLVDAQIDASGTVVDTNAGTVVVRSTGGTGISAGTFVATNPGSLTIEGGSFHASTAIVGLSTGTIEVRSGAFYSNKDCFNDIIGNATFRDATMTAADGGYCLTVLQDGNVEIYGGKYTATDDCIFSSGKVVLHVGASFEATNDSDGCLSGDGYDIADDAMASPMDWQEASKVEFITSAITVRFYSEGALVGEAQGTPANRAFPNDPVSSTGSAFCYWADKDGNRVDSLSSLTADTDLYATFADKTYTVTFNDNGKTTSKTALVNTPLGQVPGLDRKDDGDHFRCWKLGNRLVDESTTTPLQSNLTLTAVYGSKVMNLGELKAAVAAQDPAIELGADIEVPETITIGYDCIINGCGHKLLRSKSHDKGALLAVACPGGDGQQGLTLMVHGATLDGQNVEADTAAVTAGEGTTLVLDHTTVEKNTNADGDGGGIYADEARVELNDCTIRGNSAGGNGGGLFLEGQEPGNLVSITNSTISGNAAAYGGGGIGFGHCLVHLYGSTSIAQNTAKDGGGAHSANGNEDTSILYMHDDSRITGNTATGQGGGVNCEEMSLVMYDDSSIDNNKAAGDGGGVRVSFYGMRQLGGVIRDNQAGGSGGGVYVDHASSLTAGMMYDNTASQQGDDLYNNSGLQSLYPQQGDRRYGDGNSGDLRTVQTQAIPGYYPADQGSVLVPWYGWFVDGDNSGSGRFPGDIAKGTLVSEQNGNTGILTGDEEGVGVKAIWYGLLLAYDANYEGTTEHQYDERAYAPGSDATVRDGLFHRPGYRFTGWNTEKDGSGKTYESGDALTMNKSQVLYAQWERDDTPTTPDNPDTPSRPANPTTPSATPAGTAVSDNQPAPEPEKALPQTGDDSLKQIAAAASAGVAATAGSVIALKRRKLS